MSGPRHVRFVLDEFLDELSPAESVEAVQARFRASVHHPEPWDPKPPR